MATHWQNNPNWPIFSPEDDNDLYQRSVVKEYHEKKPRQVADQEAYGEWRKEAHAKAAAHHLRGMKAAQGSGDIEQARKHGHHYNLHMEALGHDPYAPPPEAVRRHAHAAEPDSLYRFKPHAGDSFLVQPSSEPVNKNEGERTEYTMQEAARILAGAIKSALRRG